LNSFTLRSDWQVFNDDPTIADDERLFPRIHPQQLVPDELQAGKLRVSSGAFRDEELSIIIESTLRQTGRLPLDLLRGHPTYSLVAITAAKARVQGQKVARDPVPEEPAHGVVFGKKRKCASTLATDVEWIVPPSPRPSA
jgi:hypothetical protein